MRTIEELELENIRTPSHFLRGDLKSLISMKTGIAGGGTKMQTLGTTETRAIVEVSHGPTGSPTGVSPNLPLQPMQKTTMPSDRNMEVPPDTEFLRSWCRKFEEGNASVSQVAQAMYQEGADRQLEVSARWLLSKTQLSRLAVENFSRVRPIGDSVENAEKALSDIEAYAMAHWKTYACYDHLVTAADTIRSTLRRFRDLDQNPQEFEGPNLDF